MKDASSATSTRAISPPSVSLAPRECVFDHLPQRARPAARASSTLHHRPSSGRRSATGSGARDATPPAPSTSPSMRSTGEPEARRARSGRVAITSTCCGVASALARRLEQRARARTTGSASPWWFIDAARRSRGSVGTHASSRHLGDLVHVRDRQRVQRRADLEREQTLCADSLASRRPRRPCRSGAARSRSSSASSRERLRRRRPSRSIASS